MKETKPDYHAYLLRLWRVGTDQKSFWRGSLENPHTGEEITFAQIGDLLTFLKEKTRSEVHVYLEDQNRQPADLTEGHNQEN